MALSLQDLLDQYRDAPSPERLAAVGQGIGWKRDVATSTTSTLNPEIWK